MIKNKNNKHSDQHILVLLAYLTSLTYFATHLTLVIRDNRCYLRFIATRQERCTKVLFFYYPANSLSPIRLSKSTLYFKIKYVFFCYIIDAMFVMHREYEKHTRLIIIYCVNFSSKRYRY